MRHALYAAVLLLLVTSVTTVHGNGCTDWKELLSGWDPFDPNDC